MTPPRISDEHFRFDGEFVKLIQTQSEQKIMLQNMSEKIENIKEFNGDNFDKLNSKLEELTKCINGIQTNCVAHKVLTNQPLPQPLVDKSTSLLLGMKPEFLKGLVFIIIVIIGYVFGTPVKVNP